MTKRCLLLFFVAICFKTNALPVGEWTTHFAYDTVTQAIATENKIFAISQQRMFSATPVDGTVDTYTRLDGFSSDKIQKIGYDDLTGRLLIYYSDAGIDVVSKDGYIYTIPDIKDSEISNDKTLNQIYFRDGHAYLSCNFGIVNLNMRKLETSDSYIFRDEKSSPLPVYGFTCDETYFYALVDNTIKQAPINGVNLSDFNNWGVFNDNLPQKSRDLLFWGGSFVVYSSDGSCYYFDKANGEWNVLLSCGGTISMQIESDNLIICNGSSLWILSGTASSHTQTTYQYPALSACIKNGDIWAGTTSGLVHYDNNGQTSSFVPGGPATNYGQFSYYLNDKIYVCPGLISIDRGYYPAVLQIYDGNKWSNIKASTTGAYNLAPDGWTNDFTSIATDPTNENHIFISAWGEGIFEYLDGQAVKLHNYDSSGGVLHYAEPYDNGHVVRTSGLLFDNDGVLWVANSFQSDPLKYMTQDGIWHTAACKVNGNYPRMTQLMISSHGLKWINNNSANAAIIVIDDNGTYDDDSDDDARIFNSFTDQNGNVLTPSYCYQLAEDRNGAVWAVTSSGPVIFNNISKIFNSNYNCSRILIPRNDGSGLADFLLDGVDTKAIAIDGANRKWIGTSNAGLYLISADGQRQLAHYTTDNSPLSSNDIQSLCINKNSGELLIVTQTGIYSYMTDSTEPLKSFPKEGPHVYPNPVRPDYSGMITIKGLEENSIVRITDSAGNLVFEGTSTGGSLSWNGKNSHGRNIAAGIYYVHCSNSDSDNNRSSATKFLVIR